MVLTSFVKMLGTNYKVLYSYDDIIKCKQNKVNIIKSNTRTFSMFEVGKLDFIGQGKLLNFVHLNRSIN